MLPEVADFQKRLCPARALRGCSFVHYKAAQLDGEVLAGSLTNPSTAGALKYFKGRFSAESYKSSRVTLHFPAAPLKGFQDVLQPQTLSGAF